MSEVTPSPPADNHPLEATPDGKPPPGARPVLAPEVLERMRRTRRYPRPTQFDYLHLRHLVEDLAAAIGSIEGPVVDVLDAFCGTRPYDDLLPSGARCVGYDIDNQYGAADVVGADFLPFDDESFDLVMTIEAFHFAPDPVEAAAEIRRVLRPGGTALITVPFSWEYDRRTTEHRFTEPDLRALFADWEDVRIVENGGRGVAWAILTARFLAAGQRRLGRLGPVLLGPAFALINLIGMGLERVDRIFGPSPFRFPMNLLLLARRPA